MQGSGFNKCLVVIVSLKKHFWNVSIMELKE